MNDTMGPWIAALAIILMAIPALAFYLRYGRAYLDYPGRLGRLMGRLGLNYERLPNGAKNVATFRCNTCAHSAACSDWLEHQSDKFGYRVFCPNGAFLDGLVGDPNSPTEAAEPPVKAETPARPRHRPF